MSLSVNDDRGVFFCHVCHESGDKITFIRKLYGCDFKEALSFFGLEKGDISKPDPAQVERNFVNQTFRDVVKRETKRVGKLIYELNKTEYDAVERLKNDSGDKWASFAFRIASQLIPKYTAAHDALLSKDVADQLEAIRYLREGRL